MPAAALRDPRVTVRTQPPRGGNGPSLGKMKRPPPGGKKQNRGKGESQTIGEGPSQCREEDQVAGAGDQEWPPRTLELT